MSIKETTLNILFPPKCAFCGKIMDTAASGICPACEKDLPYRPEGKILQKVGGFDCAVTFYYEGSVKEGIRALKFRNKPARAAVFGAFLARTAAEHLGGRFDTVTFVPVSFLRNFKRGYDQSRLLAEAAARVWGVKARKTLVKIRNNPPQSSVKTPAERRANALGSYRSCADVRGKRLLLIDDVCTSGSTMAECARTLMEAGAAEVVCAALAGGHCRQTDSAKKETA